ncbi:MAG TPA: ribonuclease P protein component [Chthoniobacteraceae bacterium]|nr:ribonuclease P protein component [Chthoniobacteraceae bacterium]
MPLTFPKALRLTRSSEFLRIKNEGRSYPGRYMVVGVLRDERTAACGNKVGVITSRRVGGAVVRNRVRRRFRELLRLSQPTWQPGVWAVLIARHTAPGATYEELHREWTRLGQRSGFLRREF